MTFIFGKSFIESNMDHTLTAKTDCWFASDVTAAMLVVKNKRVSLRWEMNSILMQILQKSFFCIDHQHGRLVTWLQTKNTTIQESCSNKYCYLLRSSTTLRCRFTVHSCYLLSFFFIRTLLNLAEPKDVLISSHSSNLWSNLSLDVLIRKGSYIKKSALETETRKILTFVA